MKYLEIKDKQGYFKRGEVMLEIDKINESDLYNLIDHAYDEDFEIDEYQESELPNKAQQIIYQNIYTKLSDFLVHKNQFEEASNTLYAEAIGKYKVDISAEPEISENISQQFEEDVDDINPEDIPF